jgi:hypothetical protein
MNSPFRMSQDLRIYRAKVPGQMRRIPGRLVHEE